MSNQNDGTTRLLTLDDDGSVPKTRLGNAPDAQAMVLLMVRADNATRSRRRGLVKGLVDGNPPYRAGALKAAGRPDACNVNWRIAEYYLNAALGAFYDVFNEAPTYATVKTGYGPEAKRAEWSTIITEEFDRLQHRDAGFDYNMQISQYEMVLYGCGPLVFPDRLDWRCQAVKCMNLLVPEDAKSDVSLWELSVMRRNYLPHELYDYIANPEAAAAVGWDVGAVKQAIIHAYPLSQQGGVYLNWEWYQQQIKNGSFLWVSLQSRTIQVAHIFVKEFAQDGEVTGRITHSMVQENVAETGNAVFLYQKIGRFASWLECVHPMYYDHGGGGDHHSVSGMGVKMYGAMEFQNRLLCNQADKAFAPKVMFKPTTGDAIQKFSVAHLGDWGIVPKGFDVVQTGIQGLLQDGLEFNNEISQIISSNLSQYRQNVPEKNGNPVTATQVNYDASEQSRLGKTQLNRYYMQLDWLYAEKYRRASNPNLTAQNPGGAEALEFQKRCKDRGVPAEALLIPDTVQATRLAGQGSPYMRIQALQSIMSIVAMLPENGRANLISDVIAAQTGQTSVKRYYDVSPEAMKPTDQNAFAMSQVADMKVGVAPVVTDTQNPVIYAQTFLQAASQAAQSVQQGADKAEVAQFIHLAGAAIHAHLERIKADPTRKQVYDTLFGQWEQLAKFSDQLEQQLQKEQEQKQKAMQQAAQAAQAAHGGDPQAAMEAARTASEMHTAKQQGEQDMALKGAATRQKLTINQQKHAQQMAINDAKAAADIRTKAATAKANAARAAKKAKSD